MYIPRVIPTFQWPTQVNLKCDLITLQPNTLKEGRRPKYGNSSEILQPRDIPDITTVNDGVYIPLRTHTHKVATMRKPSTCLRSSCCKANLLVLTQIVYIVIKQSQRTILCFTYRCIIRIEYILYMIKPPVKSALYYYNENNCG